MGCNSGMVITFVPGLSDERLNVKPAKSDIVLIKPVSDIQTKRDYFLVKNYKKLPEQGEELYEYAKNNWKKYSITFDRYEIKFMIQSDSVNLRNINAINSFYDAPLLNKINKSLFMQFQFEKDTVVIEKFWDSKSIFTTKRKI
jgi:hypothetical protein